MIGDWLLIGLVVVSLWAFWWWLGSIFDAISAYHRHRGNIDDAEREQIRRDLEEQRALEDRARAERMAQR